MPISMEWIAQGLALIGGLYCLCVYICVNRGILVPRTKIWYYNNLVGSVILLTSNFLGAVNAGSILLEVCYIFISIYYLRRYK